MCRVMHIHRRPFESIAGSARRGRRRRVREGGRRAREGGTVGQGTEGRREGRDGGKGGTEGREGQSDGATQGPGQGVGGMGCRGESGDSDTALRGIGPHTHTHPGGSGRRPGPPRPRRPPRPQPPSPPAGGGENAPVGQSSVPAGQNRRLNRRVDTRAWSKQRPRWWRPPVLAAARAAETLV